MGTRRVTGFARYAIYWAPEDDDALRTFGAAWLGHDPDHDGAVFERRVRLGLPDDFVDRITAEPRRYGLHATLKAPFRLKPGTTMEQLAAQAGAVAAAMRAFTTLPLRMSRLHGFLALRPAGPSPELDELARRCVVDLDSSRAPLDDTELARRNPAALSAAQRKLLESWGYPYVLSEYAFHITLTGRLTEHEHAEVEPLLDAATSAFQAEPFAVRSIALFGDPGEGRPFRLVQRFALSPA